MQLVGSAGAVAYGNPNYTGEIEPSFGQATTAHNLLIATLYSGSSDATNPFTCDDGTWVQRVVSGGAYNWSSIWYKPNCGSGETAPQFGISDATTTAGMLLEFSGGATSGVADQAGPTTAAGATLVATATAPDSGGGELVIFAGGWNGGSGATTISITGVDSAGNSITMTGYDDPADTTGFKYAFGWGFAGNTTGAGYDTITAELGVYSGGGCCMASFKPGAAAPAGAGALVWAAII